MVSPVTGRITRPPRVQLGSVVAAGAPLLEILPVLGVPEPVKHRVGRPWDDGPHPIVARRAECSAHLNRRGAKSELGER